MDFSSITAPLNSAYESTLDYTVRPVNNHVIQPAISGLNSAYEGSKTSLNDYVVQPFNSTIVEPVKAFGNDWIVEPSNSAINSVSQAAIDGFNGMTEVPYGSAISSGAAASTLSGAVVLVDAKRRADEGDSVNAKKEAAAGAVLLTTGASLTAAMMYLAHQAGVVAREAAEQLKEQLKEQLSQAQGEGKLFAKALEGAKDKGALSEALEKQGSALKEELVKAVQDKSVDAANKVVAQMKDLSTEIQLRENTNSAVLVAKDLWTHYFG